jgi:hypothetical protein
MIMKLKEEARAHWGYRANEREYAKSFDRLDKKRNASSYNLILIHLSGWGGLRF